MKRITMIGDVGWSRFYHLGDEAMTELAIDALRDRTDIEITLIAGEPEYAGRMYGVDAIPRIGFKRDRKPNIARMKKVLAHVEGESAGSTLAPDDPAVRIIEAVRNSDAVLVAGGGNLNSMFAHHIYERATLAKIARALGKPYALTSQTLGPLIYEEDRGLVHDLLAEAQFIGTRESYTTDIAEELSSGEATVRRQVDDAFSLTASDDDRAAVSDLAAEPFILASFAEKASTPMISDTDYHARLAELTRRVADDTGLRVLLVPHGGALPPADQTRDQLTDITIAEASGNDNVVPTRMLTARQLVALTEQAAAVIGTRYHAAIFAGAAAVPFISLAPNLYSSIRMRGAAENVGMENYVLPLDSVDDIVATAVGVISDRDSLAAALRGQSTRRREEHQEWWNFLVAKTLGETASTAEAPGFFHAAEIPNPYVADIDVVRERLNAVQDYGLVMALKDRKLAQAKAEVTDAKAELKRLQSELDRARQSREQTESEPAVRAARRVEDTGRRAAALARKSYRHLASLRR
ncbi:polysaccharide pyruvyl transferase family protein [Brevibacterium oceani]|uniref:polysaccharide pyruvyl transferase family protein n=1 Tax=Brevibacterium oceani TaxID=358099 RepID=UPI001B31F53A|nr:polysaccharide pyruvyl transferase family protein [Brevibacterium oceani]